MNRSTQPFFLNLAILLILGGCTNPDSNTAEYGAVSVIHRGNIEAPGTLDPALAEDVHTFNVLIDLYEGLVAEDAHGALVPGVAESWSISDDGLTYTFTLRETARWSNGERVTAGDFVRSLRRVAAPETLSAYAFLLQPIEHFAAVHDGSAAAETLGVSAPDQGTLVIRLARPSPPFLGVLAMPVAFPVYDAKLSASNGAYLLVERKAGQAIRLRRNSQYWDAGSVQIAEVQYVPIADEVAELNMYRAGELDITAVIPASHVAIVKEELPGETRIAPSLAFYYFAFDLTEPPLDNRLLRQALSMAIDREQLVQLLGRGEQAAYGIVPPGVANHRGARYAWRDLSQEERQQQALAAFHDAGYGADQPLKLKVTYDIGGIHERVALAVSAMWQEVLGIEVELEKKEWKYFLDTRDDRAAWQVMRFSWFGDYNDAATFTDIFHSASPQNLPRYASAVYDSAITQAATEMDSSIRAASLRRAEDILLQDYPLAPLYFYVSKHMVKPYVQGFEDNVLDRHPSRYLFFSTDDKGAAK